MTISWSFLRIKPNQVYCSQDHPAWETLKITQQEYEVQNASNLSSKTTKQINLKINQICKPGFPQ